MPTVISPASAATRASSGTVWYIANGWERKCWPAHTEAKPRSRATRTCSRCSRTPSAPGRVRRVLAR